MGNVKNIWNWKKEPLRYDPSRGYLLCEHCWNGAHFLGSKKIKNCLELGCACGCAHDLPNRRPKFTGKGQTGIPMDDPITIGRRS